MRVKHIVKWGAAASVIAAGLGFSIEATRGQVRSQPLVEQLPIQSLSEPGQGFLVRDVAQQTGFVTFASTPRDGLLLPIDLGASAESRALGFVDLYGAPFGLTNRSQLQLLTASPADILGLEHVKFQQFHQGVPVRGAEFIVHLEGSRAMAANGHVTNDLPVSVVAEIAANVAQSAAVAMIVKHKPDHAATASYSEPRLEIFNRALLSDHVNTGSRLAWFVQATGPALDEYIWVDARSGAILLNFSQLAHAKSRRVHSAGFSNSLPGTLMRSEGQGPTFDTDVDKAYDYAGLTYDYFFANHGRDSFDNAGAAIVSTTDYCPNATTCPNYANAFWSGPRAQMVYGNGFSSADDVVAHELTHAVTERSAGLLYYVQSGALNESMSDIFGETIDLTDGVGTDTAGVRWRMGEDLPAPFGAIRNMMNPNEFGDPARMGDPLFVCGNSPWTDPNGDSGGVHVNSGIPNHAFALMADGGSFNGRTVSAIGLTKAAKIHYRALTSYLTSGATFLDHYNAINQSCTDLIGTLGITAADCTNVTTALQAVEMNAVWACSGAVAPPPLCPTGAPTITSTDTFESGMESWVASNATLWGRTPDFAKTGTWSAYGDDPGVQSDHQLTRTAAVVIPPGGRLYFDHAFEFENDSTANYDTGVVEYSANGATWIDAGSLIDGGQSYNGTVFSGSGNVLGGRAGFVKTSFGYTGTRLNLSSLAGQSVRFRFRIGSDASVGSLGWLIDNISLYSCATGGGSGAPGPPTNFNVSASDLTIVGMWTSTGPAATSHTLQVATTSAFSPVLLSAHLGAVNSFVIEAPPGTVGTFHFRIIASNAAGSSAPSSGVAVAVPAVPSAPGNPILNSAVVSGNSVTLSWAQGSGGSPSSYLLIVGSSPGASNVGVFPMGNSTSISANAPDGTYFARVQAVNGGGSGISNEITFTVGTPCVSPGTPMSVVATQVGGVITVNWAPPTTGTGPFSYTVVAGSSTGASNIGIFPVGGSLSISAPAPTGAYFIRLRASNACGVSGDSTEAGVVVP